MVSIQKSRARSRFISNDLRSSDYDPQVGSSVCDNNQLTITRSEESIFCWAGTTMALRTEGYVKVGWLLEEANAPEKWNISNCVRVRHIAEGLITFYHGQSVYCPDRDNDSILMIILRG